MMDRQQAVTLYNILTAVGDRQSLSPTAFGAAMVALGAPLNISTPGERMDVARILHELADDLERVASREKAA